MAVIVLASACGSPGVTSTALGLALAWPRPCVLVEADPTGGSAILAGFFRGDVPPGAGLIDLAFAHHQGTLAQELPLVTMPLPGSDARLVAGTRAHGQAASLAGVWSPLLEELSALEDNGQDVLVDAGRLGLVGSPEPLIYGADVTLLVTRSDLPALAGARSWAATLRESSLATGAPSALGVLLVGPGRPYSAGEVSSVLRIPVTASVAWDPDASGVYARGATPPRKFESSALVRSLRASVSAIQSAAAAAQAATSGPVRVGANGGGRS